MGEPMAGNENVNARFFDDWKDYQQLVESIDTYAFTTRALVGELHGRVVDVGSGGVVNYHCDGITELVLVDISTDYPTHGPLPTGAVLKTGSAVALPLSDGAHDCLLEPGTRAAEAYDAERISERHRHRYEFNPEYRDQFTAEGMQLSGVSPDGRLVEIVEVANHPWFLAVQFHPEFKSRPESPHPLFADFISAGLMNSLLAWPYRT